MDNNDQNTQPAQPAQPESGLSQPEAPVTPVEPTIEPTIEPDLPPATELPTTQPPVGNIQPEPAQPEIPTTELPQPTIADAEIPEPSTTKTLEEISGIKTQIEQTATAENQSTPEQTTATLPEKNKAELYSKITKIAIPVVVAIVLGIGGYALYTVFMSTPTEAPTTEDYNNEVPEGYLKVTDPETETPPNLTLDENFENSLKEGLETDADTNTETPPPPSMADPFGEDPETPESESEPEPETQPKQKIPRT